MLFSVHHVLCDSRGIPSVNSLSLRFDLNVPDKYIEK